MKKMLHISMLLILFSSTALAAGGFEPAPADQAVVYIGRMTGFVGAGRPFHFFAGENYLAHRSQEIHPDTSTFGTLLEPAFFISPRLRNLLSKQSGSWSASDPTGSVLASSRVTTPDC